MQIHFSQQFPWGDPTMFIPKVWKSLEQNSLASIDEYYRSLHEKKQESLSWYLNHQLPFGQTWFDMKEKPHTIRADKSDRWQPGKMIHFVVWTGKPYRSKTLQFAPLLPCVSTQKIDIKYNRGGGVNVFIDGKFFHYQTEWGLEWDATTKRNMELLAQNDGFDSVQDFFRWFNKDFIGKIIHWTNLKY